MYIFPRHSAPRRLNARLVVRAKQTEASPEDPKQITEKYGLEVGLLKTMTDKNADGKSKMSSAKELLAKYGSAYLITSITLSLISFGLCYFLIDSGVDVAALLAKVGIEVRFFNSLLFLGGFVLLGCRLDDSMQ